MTNVLQERYLQVQKRGVEVIHFDGQQDMANRVTKLALSWLNQVTEQNRRGWPIKLRPLQCYQSCTKITNLH